MVIDHIEEGRAKRQQFVGEMLAAFGATVTSELVDRICGDLPEDLDAASSLELMKAFERALPLQWDENLQQIGVERAAAFVDALYALLAARTPDQLPKHVSSMVVEEL